MTLIEKIADWAASPSGRAVQYLTIDDIDDLAVEYHEHCAHIDALEALAKAADGLADAAHLLACEAHQNMMGGRGHLIDDVSRALTTYRAAQEAANG